MNRYVIINLGAAWMPPGTEDADAGCYLAAYDPDGRDGRGRIEWTVDPARALVFGSAAAAMKCWNRQSVIRPFRDDGKPNKPLTGYTVEIVPAGADAGAERAAG